MYFPREIPGQKWTCFFRIPTDVQAPAKQRRAAWLQRFPCRYPFSLDGRFIETCLQSYPQGSACTRLSELWEFAFPKIPCRSGNPGAESSHQAKWVNTGVAGKMGSQVREPSPRADAGITHLRAISALLLKPSGFILFRFLPQVVYITRLMSITFLGNHTW